MSKYWDSEEIKDMDLTINTMIENKDISNFLLRKILHTFYVRINELEQSICAIKQKDQQIAELKEKLRHLQQEYDYIRKDNEDYSVEHKELKAENEKLKEIRSYYDAQKRESFINGVPFSAEQIFALGLVDGLRDFNQNTKAIEVLEEMKEEIDCNHINGSSQVNIKISKVLKIITKKIAELKGKTKDASEITEYPNA